MKRSSTLQPQHISLLLFAMLSLLAIVPVLVPADVLRTPRFAPQFASDSLPSAAATPLAAQRPLLGSLAPAEAFAALEARGGEPLTVRWNSRSGIPDFLRAASPDGRLPYTPTAAELGNPEAIARGFLDQNRALFGLRSAAQDLQLLRNEPDLQLGYSHLRFDQRYAGIPVFGHQLVVHLDQDQQIVAVNGEFQPALTLATEASITPEQAESLALEQVAKELLLSDAARVQLHLVPDETQLMVYVDESGRSILTWNVLVLTEKPLGQWQFFINARRPVVVHAIDSVMPIKRRRTFTANNGTNIPGRLVIDEGERSRDDVAQAAHDGAGIVYDYFFNTFQRDAYDGQGSPMDSTVHYGSDPEDAENAAWVGEYAQMIYGDGGQIFHPLPYGLDVVGHEFTHGVIETSANLIYENQSGALNESYADIFGALIDRDNWTIGEQVIKSPPFPTPYLRSLEDPNADGFYDPREPLNGIGQPATMSEYADLPNSRRADNGGVHINSGIPNRAAFLVAEAIGREAMEQIYYRALTQYLSPQSDFLDAADATIQAATDLYGEAEVTAVRNAFAEVGITTGEEPTTTPTTPDDTLPDSGPVEPPPVEALPAGCTDLVISGGFEDDEGWVEVVNGDTGLIDTQLPYSGSYSAWLGGTDQEQLQYIYQDVRIPANATQVELNYTRLVHFEITGLLGLFSAEATLSSLIANTNGDVVAALEEIPSTDGDDEWREMSFDLSRYAGKTVRLVFSAENPRGDVSSMFVDDVALIACTSGVAPDAPPVPNADLVYLKGQIIDSSTRRGIAGAQVFVMRPGVSASRAASDDNLTADEVLTVGTADDSGIYQTNEAIPRNQSYGVVVFARGYRPIISDGAVNVPADAKNPHRIDAELRKSR